MHLIVGNIRIYCVDSLVWIVGVDVTVQKAPGHLTGLYGCMHTHIRFLIRN